MPPVLDRSTFESAYAGQAPWDIGRPQKTFVEVADRISGSVLDAGCGTGDRGVRDLIETRVKELIDTL
jgi:hypothetical protein